jgi:5-formyltetrahydrofolate cyclo-ligase
MTADASPSPGALAGAALHDAKHAMRARIGALRDALPAPQRAAMAAAIAAAIARLPSFAAARTVLLTLPYRSEWDAMPLLAAAFAQGKAVAVPRVEPATRMLELHAIRDVARDVGPGYRGIPEPHASMPRVDPGQVDWVLVPGVAFDATGHRLGYGGGFYDRLLPLLPATAQRIAGAFDLQVVEHVPAAVHDLRVHAIVTPTRTLQAHGAP